MSQKFRYKAFLSYSHTDHREAVRLHRALENYKLPAAIAAKVGSPRLGKIFRDRDELPAADDLTKEVKKALESSEFMIVLCSPRAAASRWVNKEIIEFKKLRGDAAVLPIIMEGEPYASAGKNPEDECFPPGLRFRLGTDGSLSRTPAEPIAADMRRTADGRQRALQKLIAGLLHVGLDQLIERELQRKHRRVIAVTAASMLATVVMGALTYQAYTARNEAEQSRAQAEDLVEFMLTDMRQKLEPVGRLDIFEAIGGEALTYYDKQPLDGMSEASLGRRSRAFHMLGEVASNRGDLIKAQSMFEAAADATRSLLERSPNDTDRVFEHSQSLFWLGYHDWQIGKYEEAQKAFEGYRLMALRLVEADPKNPDWHMEVAYANANLGTLYLEQLDRPREALELFKASRDSLVLIEAITPDDINVKLNMADRYAWMADSYKRFGTMEQVLENRQREQEILRQVLAADTDYASANIALMISLVGESRIRMLAGDEAGAAEALGEASELGKRMVEHDPDNRLWRARYGEALYLRAAWAVAAGDQEQAHRCLEKARNVSGEIINAQTPTMAQKVAFRYAAIAIEADLAVLEQREDLVPVLGKVEAALAAMIGEQDAIESTRGGPAAQMALYNAKARLLRRMGKAVQAEDTLRAAIQRLNPDMETLRPELLQLVHGMAVRAQETQLSEALEERLLARGLKLVVE